MLLEGVAPEQLEPPVNVLRLALHPDGVAPRIVNLGEWRAHLLERLQRQVVATHDPQLITLLNELRGYPCDQPEPSVEMPGPGEIVVPLRLRHGDGELRFMSIVSTFGTPLDITVAGALDRVVLPGRRDHRGGASRRGLSAPAQVKIALPPADS